MTTYKRKSLLCKLGFHSREKGYQIIRRQHRGNKILSRSAYCHWCSKKLYRVDKYEKK